MPRDSSGNYSLPAGNPVVTNTVIAASWANPTLDDIATALTDSLDRQGRGGMLAPFQFADGTAGQPSITWTGETNTGFYRDGAQDMRAVVAGVQSTRWIDDGAGGATFQIFDDGDSLWKDAAHENSVIRFGDGTIDAPSITWFGTDGIDGVDEGWYRAADHDQRYVQDVAAVQTDIFQFTAGEALALTTGWGVSGLGMRPVTAGVRTTPADDSSNPDEVADVGYVRAKATLIAQGVGDGNSSTFLGDTIGAAAWASNGGGDYDLALSVPVSNINNLVVHLTVLETGDSAGRYVFLQSISNPSAPNIVIRSNGAGGAGINSDSIMFSVFDSGT